MRVRWSRQNREHLIARRGRLSRVYLERSCEQSRSWALVIARAGVETKGQVDAIPAEGCTKAQRYLLSAPKPAHDIA